MAKTFQKRAAQGDILITRLDKLPDGLTQIPLCDSGKYTLSHSETGHAHVLEGRAAKMFIDETNGFIAYLQVMEPSEIEHLRNFDTHESIALDEGYYEVRRQREYTAEGFRRAQD